MSGPEQRAWMVERTRDVFEDVNAQNMAVLDSGAVQFTYDDDSHCITYAPGQWITVFPAEDS